MGHRAGFRLLFGSVEQHSGSRHERELVPVRLQADRGSDELLLNANTAGEVLGRTLKLDVGLRYAVTRHWGYNFASQKDTSGNLTYPKVKLHSDYDTLLPTVAVSYDLMDDLVARAAYGQTITRADLGSIAKGASVPNIYNPNVSLGNSDLKPFTATNIDLGLEWYFDQGSVLSFGVFYKGIKNLISTVTTNNVPWGTLNLPDSLLASNQHINNDASQPVDPNYMMSVTHPGQSQPDGGQGLRGLLPGAVLFPAGTVRRPGRDGELYLHRGQPERSGYRLHGE